MLTDEEMVALMLADPRVKAEYDAQAAEFVRLDELVSAGGRVLPVGDQAGEAPSLGVEWERVNLLNADWPHIKRCDECGSDYRAAASRMMQLCPECSFWLYGYPSCKHEFEGGRCLQCYWDGSKSVYVRKLQTKAGGIYPEGPAG